MIYFGIICLASLAIFVEMADRAPELPWHERRWVRVGMGVAGTTVVVAVIAAILTRASGTTRLGGTIGVD